MKKYKYDIARYNFRQQIQDIFKTDELEMIHKRRVYEVFERKNDQKTIFHKTFYSSFHGNHEFVQTYESFIKTFVAPLLQDEHLIYQKVPTFRCHLVNNKAVGEFHKDSDYNHPKSELNFFVPVTDSKGSSTIWIESTPDKGDYAPVNLEYGELFTFYGGLYSHGNKINNTGKTRVGFDFRVILSKDYVASPETSLNVKKRFIVGEYYDRL